MASPRAIVVDSTRQLEASFGHCRRIARARARNFYYSFLLLPKAEKDAMCAVYAFMRYADDVSDDPNPPPETRRLALEQWKQALERVLAHDVPDHPIMLALHATIQRYEIPGEYFFELMKGVTSDLEPQRYRTFDELYEYCYRVASVVGMIIIHIFGFDRPEALKLAEKCGIGFQLTNILRDVPEDAERGRVYLPEQDLERFKLTGDDLASGPRNKELMSFEWDRAESYYREAAPLLDMVRPVNRPALWAMISIYHGLLQRIRDQDFDVYSRRPRLTAIEKSLVVAKAARGRWLGGPLPFPA